MKALLTTAALALAFAAPMAEARTAQPHTGNHATASVQAKAGGKKAAKAKAKKKHARKGSHKAA